MWLLISKKQGQDVKRLLVGRQYSVGRMDCDITIPEDKSISRKHAVLQVSYAENKISQPHQLPSLSLQDLSKFGTILDSNKLEKGTPCTVNSGQTVKFGTVDSIYEAVYQPMVTTTSCLANEDKKACKQLVAQLGGHLVAEWQKQSSFLIMSHLSVTVKVICALITQKPIVNPQYLKDYVAAVEANVKPPAPTEYIPPLAESQLNPNEVSFKNDERRSKIFEGKIFVFLSSKQFKKLNNPVSLGGGVPYLMEESTNDNTDDILIRNGSCIMHFEADQSTESLSQNAVNFISHVTKLLRKHGRRMIPDSELGYAVLYCSTNKYCNPLYREQASYPETLPSQSVSQAMQPSVSEVLVPDTGTQQSSQRRSNHTAESVVPPSVISPPGGQLRAGHRSPIKQEQVSQDDTRENKRLSRKRDREEEATTLPEAKSQRKGRERSRSPAPVDIKREPITPFKPAENNTEKANHNAATKYNGKSSKGPQKSTQNSNIWDQLDSDEDDTAAKVDDLFNEFDFGVSRNRRRESRKSPERESVNKTKTRGRSRSPSPSSRTSRRQEQGHSKSPSPLKMSARNRNNSPSPEPRTSKNLARASKTNRNSSKSPSPVRRRNNIKQEIQSDSPGPSRTSNRKRARSSSKSPSPARRRNEVKQETAHSESPSPGERPARGSRHRSPSPVTRSKDSDEAKRAEEVACLKREPKSSPSTPQPRSRQCHGSEAAGPVPEGFINKSKYKSVALSEHAVTDEQQPICVVLTEFRDLLVRRPKANCQQNQPILATNSSGKPVKNFKNFRKTETVGSRGLPRIIGATDLVRNSESKKNKDMEEWFQQGEQAASQKETEDRLSKELFDWEPVPMKRKR